MNTNTFENDLTISEPTVISLDELRQKTSSGAALAIAEILPAKYFESGHLPNAVHLPLDGFETIARRVLPDPNADVVVYCANAACKNSDIAARKLASMGYTRVRIFAAGKAAWGDAGLPLVAGPS